MKRLMRLLAILALLFAPLGMIGGHAAMAMPVAAAPMIGHAAAIDPAGHCAEVDRQAGDRSGSSIDCLIACSALPSTASEIAAHPSAASVLRHASPAVGLRGLHPESDPPPPRLA